MIKTFSTIAIAALSIAATASLAQASNALLCPGALDQRDDPKIAAATGVALPGVGYAKEDADGECLYPHTLLSFEGADVLIVNKKWIRGPGHSDPALLSAFVLRRDGDKSRLVTVYRDFTSIGTMGEPGDIEAIKLGNDDAFYALPGGVYQGYGFTDLDISVFRGGKLVSLSALRVNASNEGAKEDEKDAVSVDGDYQFNQPEPGKLTINFKVKNRGLAREERVVYRLEDTTWVVESGKEPSEEIQEGAGG